MDAFIVKQLKTLRKVKPSASWLESQRSFLLSEISQGQEKKKKPFLIFNPVLIFRPAFAFALAIIILITSFTTAGVISAAQNSLPGDLLYPLKTAFEKVQVTLTAGEANKTRLSIKLATQRIDEINQLIDKPEADKSIKKQNIEKTVQNFTAQMIDVQKNIDKLKDKNTQKATEVAKLIKTQTPIYEETLIGSTERLSDVIGSDKENLQKNFDKALEEVNKTNEITDKIAVPEEESNPEEKLMLPSEKVESESLPFEDLQK